jgi:hypothetical protein
MKYYKIAYAGKRTKPTTIHLAVEVKPMLSEAEIKHSHPMMGAQSAHADLAPTFRR